jgi:GT2 family glycosyltransferase
LLYPDGTIQTAGTVFLEGNTLPHHFLSGHPIGDALVAPNADFSAVTAAALCMRAIDFIELRGFDAIYTNGLEDVDLCLRARELVPGGMFRVVLESRVTHHEGKTPGRARAINVNRQVFVERWEGRIPRPDNWRYEALGITVDD